MSIMSYTITVEQEENGFSAYCETAKKVIEGPSVLSFGPTPLEAAKSAYESLIKQIEEEKELEIQAALDDLLADQDTGNTIPGGFDGIGEFSDELETAVKSLISMVHKGMTEREQHRIAWHIQEGIAGVELGRVPDDDEEAQ